MLVGCIVEYVVGLKNEPYVVYVTNDASDVGDVTVRCDDVRLAVCGTPMIYVPAAVPLGLIVENVVELENEPYVVKVTNDAEGVEKGGVGVGEATPPGIGTPTM